MTRQRVNLFVVYFAMSLALSQWYYAADLYGARFTVIPKVFTSLFFLSLLALFRQLAVRSISLDSPRARLLLFVVGFYVFVTLASVAYTFSFSGWGPDVLEGVKLVCGLMAGVSLFSQLKNRNHSIVTFFLVILTISIVFGVVQAIEQPDFFTEEAFFTYGATNRWWELSAIWGPFSFSGKNVFGLCIVYPLAILLPLLSSPYLSRYRANFIWSLYFLAVPVLFLSQSRTSFILFFVISANTYFQNRTYIKSKLSNVSITLFSIVGVLYFFISIFPTWISRSQNEQTRYAALRLAFNSEKTNWVFGSGFNSVYSVTAPSNATFTPNVAANEGSVVDVYFIRRWIETGLIGELSFLILILTLLLYSRHRIRALAVIENSVSWRQIASRNLAFVIVISSGSGDFLSFQIIAVLFTVCLSAIIFGVD